jgi:hypothetical protein
MAEGIKLKAAQTVGQLANAPLAAKRQIRKAERGLVQIVLTISRINEFPVVAVTR